MRVTIASSWLTQIDGVVSRHHSGERLSSTQSVPWKGEVVSLQRARGRKQGRIMCTQNHTLAHYLALMLSSWQSTLCMASSIEILWGKQDRYSICNLWPRNSRFTEVKMSVQSHKVNKWQSRVWNSDRLTPCSVGLPNAGRICWHLRDVNRLTCLVLCLHCHALELSIPTVDSFF